MAGEFVEHGGHRERHVLVSARYEERPPPQFLVHPPAEPHTALPLPGQRRQGRYAFPDGLRRLPDPSHRLQARPPGAGIVEWRPVT